MKKYLFIVVEDLVYVIKNEHGAYDLPDASFEISFDTTFVRTNMIECSGETYEFDLHHANIDFPGVTDNWKRRKFLSVSRNISHILLESLYNLVPSVRSAVFPIIDNDYVVLVKPSYMDYYEIPGGSIEYLGSPEETAINEAMEEASIEVKIQQYIRCRSYIVERLTPTTRINPQWFVSIEYLAKVTGGVPKPNNEIEKVSIENINNLIKGNSNITVKDDLIDGLKLVKTVLRGE